MTPIIPLIHMIVICVDICEALNYFSGIKVLLQLYHRFCVNSSEPLLIQQNNNDNKHLFKVHVSFE